MHRVEVEEQSKLSENQPFKIALVGNPNCGKTSVFNQLTGLHQKTGNFPGITVDKKSGMAHLTSDLEVEIIDLPGTYSLYPLSQDERIVAQTFANPSDPNYPDIVLYIADTLKLEKHLLLFSQIKDLGIPMILGLNMTDLARKSLLKVNIKRLSQKLQTPIVEISGRTGEGINNLKVQAATILKSGAITKRVPPSFTPSPEEKNIIESIKALLPDLNDYQALLTAHHYSWLPLSTELKSSIRQLLEASAFESVPSQVNETLHRFDKFSPIVKQFVQQHGNKQSIFTGRLDKILTHRILGPIIFLVLMVLIFQAIFEFAVYPMDWIEKGFQFLGGWVKDTLAEGWLRDLITDGIIAGLGGILVFIPQIAILFFLITILEEIGYMARAAYLFDRFMQAFGLNGRSIIALISGGACAIPAIMSTRTIGNWKERLITILVTPFISCSARIPVYTVLIAFVVPPKMIWGVFNLQGLAFMGLYVLGIGAALTSALVLKFVLKTGDTSFLMLELPDYKPPLMRNVWITVWDKVKTFALEAGRIILMVSIVLWLLASYGPPEKMRLAELQATEQARAQNLDEESAADLLAGKRLEASYAGILGKKMEPLIKPLGFNWKMGIALVTSFAAREVFIGTMATIYSIGSEKDEYSIQKRMAQEKDPVTGAPVYTLATSFSLLIFYVFAMQCMSTLAIVYRETKSWKWPLLQFTFMTTLAWVASWIVYNLFS